MRRSVSVLAMLLSVFALAPGASAQASHAAPQSSLDAALQEHVASVGADREMVLRVLDSAGVKTVAGQVGLDLRQAKSAVATLEGQELTSVATQARQVDQALAGGASTIVLSTTAIIIGLLVLILIIVAVD
jgi:ABC-type sugar transport system substrate-binding protein